MIKTLRKSWND